ncbi:M16 family metallopeptidase [Arthrobacter sp. Z1-15]
MKSGLTLHTGVHRRVPLAEFRLAIPLRPRITGSSSELEIVKRVIGLSPAQGCEMGLAESASALGAEATVEVVGDLLVIIARCLVNDLNSLLDAVASAVTKQEINTSELRRLQQAALGSLQAGSPATAIESAARYRFGDFLPPRADPAQIAAMGLVDVAEALAVHIRPTDAHIILLCEWDADYASQRLMHYFGSWTTDRLADPATPADLSPPVRTGLVSSLDSGHTGVQIGVIGPAASLDSPMYPALRIGLLAWAGYEPSRLSRTLRDKGISYGLTLSYDGLGRTTWWMCQAEAEFGKSKQLLQEVRSSLSTLRSQPLSPAEIERARIFALGYWDLSVQTQAERATALVGIVTSGVEPLWLDRYRQELASVGIHDINRAISDYLTEDEVTIALTSQ